MNLNMELQTVKREINTLSKKVEKIIVEVEKLEKPKLDVEIFDFKKKWHLVERHLNDPYILSLLDDGMERYCNQHEWIGLPDWDRKNGHGPWMFSNSSDHLEETEHKVNEDPEYKAYEKKYYNICKITGNDFEKLAMVFEGAQFENEDPKFRVLANNYRKDWDRINKKHDPKPNTYKWYQCFGASFYLAKWQEALAKKVFPNFEWRTIQNKKPFTSEHSTTIGFGLKGKKIIFDILLFNNNTLNKILDAVDVDLT